MILINPLKILILSLQNQFSQIENIEKFFNIKNNVFGDQNQYINQYTNQYIHTILDQKHSVNIKCTRLFFSNVELAHLNFEGSEDLFLFSKVED